VALALLVLTLAGLAAYVGWGRYWRHCQYRAVRQALARRDAGEARARLALCLRSWPGDAELHLLAARAARCDGAYEEAEEHLGRCRQLGGDGDAIALERAMLLAQRGDPGPAEDYLLSRLDGPHPEAALILDALAQGYLKTYRPAEALHCLDRLLELRPDDVQALLWHGDLLERLNEPDEAIASYRRAVAADPGHEKARRYLALALARSDRAEEAAGLLEGLPPDADVTLALAHCRRLLGQADEARRLLDGLLAARPGHAAALGERGKLALQAGMPAEAESWLRQSLAHDPHDRDTNYALYLCLREQGRADEAARVLETVEQIRANQQRVADLSRQVAASPRDPNLRCEVGVLCLRNGQTQEGVRWLRSALQLDPGHRGALQALASSPPQTDGVP
jgi:predicted Zn-dependent protease